MKSHSQLIEIDLYLQSAFTIIKIKHFRLIFNLLNAFCCESIINLIRIYLGEI